MFPTGTAGAALLTLRFSAAAFLLVDGTQHWAVVTSFWILLLFLLPAICLCAGFLTPYCSALSLLILLSVLFMLSGRDAFDLTQSIVICGVLAVLGPGAYSVDARLFGRKLLQVPRRTF